MSIDISAVYDEMLAGLPLNPHGIIKFKMPRQIRRRATEPARRNRAGKLDDEEQAELQRFLALEAVMRALKAKARQKVVPSWREISIPKDPEKLLAYKFPEPIQRRASELLKLNKCGLLDDQTEREMKRLLEMEGRVVLMKVKAYRAKRCSESKQRNMNK